jgi:hypothetical protein
MMDKNLWRKFIAACDEESMFKFRDYGHRAELEGRCVHASNILATIIQGKYVRGVYKGPITTTRVFAQMSREADGGMQHSWVEKDGKIYDATWWAFCDDPMSVYIFEGDDPRYKEAIQSVLR